ncbi:FAD-dependent monooxygenase [Acidicapsa ligni]|uniref:FAD-dependent monooxygenase n=1 Tax=Acidicapsa ligni TaxID=542300 RepID=UPI0021E03F89|nr:FAD-dependent monooxygenase [Acidicapsa ligni]
MPDVLVVGAGPVGLTMAAELARHGVPCRIIDRLANPLPYCRAIGVTPRTLEVWDDMGIVQPLIDAGLWLRSTRSIVNQSPARDIKIDYSDLPYGPLGIPQPETERVLTEHLSRFNIPVERPVTLVSLEQDSEGITAQLTHSDGSTESAAFQYIVGCDGAHSAVRRLLAITFEGDHFPIDFMLGDVLLDCDLPRGMMLRSINTNENGPPDFFIAIPLPERNRFRVSMLAPSNTFGNSESAHGLQAERETPSLEQLQTVADRLLPTKTSLSDLRWSSLFRISMRLASRYRTGRGFIAGDAAHIHPPTGGQGMNTGIQDAYNLAWKMALVLKGNTSPELLDTYEAERRPVGADVVSRTRTQSEQFGRKEASQQERLADTQILLNYRGSTLSKNDVSEALENLPIQAGDRAPDCYGLHRENIRAPFRLFDITRGIDHVLLLYVGQFSAPGQAELVESLAQKLKMTPGPKCRLVAICSPGTERFDAIGATILIDRNNEFASAYAPGINTGYIVRPDGYIGYHARPITESAVLNYLETVALSSKAHNPPL